MKLKILNVTPHPIVFVTPAGEEFTVNDCGVVISGRVFHRLREHPAGVTLVEAVYEPTNKGLKQLEKLEEVNPNGIIVGSVYAARAYPGRIVSLRPVTGVERSARPGALRMRSDEFTVFSPA